MTAAVALLSGGLDSGTALALWLDAGRRIELCVFADYGQRALAAEAEASRRFARRYDLEWQRVDLSWLGAAASRAGSAVMGGGRDLPERTAENPGDAESAAAVWVPARNVVFCGVAAALAEARGAGWVLTGFNREEAATFADNSPEFVHAMDAVLALGTRDGVRVTSPTIEMDKLQIVRAARRVGLARGDFWSCYAEGPEPCGVCEACVRAERAWAAAASD